MRCVLIDVVPKPLKSDQQDDDTALTTPMSVTGTPRELDEQLATQLVEFVETHLGLSSTLGVRKNKWTLPPKQQGRRPRNQQTRNPTVDPARVRVLVRRDRRQGLRRTRNRMTRNLVPSQLRYQLPQLHLWGPTRVRAACSTWNRRTATDTRPTSKRSLIHEPFPALPSSQPQDFL